MEHCALILQVRIHRRTQELVLIFVLFRNLSGISTTIITLLLRDTIPNAPGRRLESPVIQPQLPSPVNGCAVRSFQIQTGELVFLFQKSSFSLFNSYST